MMWQQGCVPVISSLALGYDGQYYNVNADQMAAACAAGCGAQALVFLTDVAGVKDASGAVMPSLRIDQIQQLVAEHVIGGGMLPKLEACQSALRHGVGQVLITPAAESATIAHLGSERVDGGTRVVRA
jgi:acetylglutamate kinase